MTLAELERFFKAKQKQTEIAQREKAYFNYILADLIGRSVSRVYNSSNKMPELNEVYPAIFTAEEIATQRAQVARDKFITGLKQFAQTQNKKIEEVGKVEQ